MDILITSGGTKIPVDRVRDITNMSSGTFGSRIAQAALEAGHSVHFLCATQSKTPFSRRFDYSLGRAWQNDLNSWAEFWNFCEHHADHYKESCFRNFSDYAEQLESIIHLEQPQVVILAAAVSDYGVANFVDGKARSNQAQRTIELTPLPKLIGSVKQWHPSCFLVGFKLLVDSTDEELIAAAKKSVTDNGCDMVVANDLRDMRANNHRLLIVREDRVTTYVQAESPSRFYLARKVIEEIELCPATSC